MSCKIAVTQESADTAGGNQTISTTKLSGLTPKAALIMVTKCASSGSVTSDNIISWGFTDGTRSRCGMHYDEDGLVTTEANRETFTNRVLQIRKTSTLYASASFVSFQANGITIDWDTTPLATYLITVVFFAGNDVSAYVGTLAPNATQDGTASTTDPGFEPDILFGINQRQAFPATGANIRESFGVAVNIVDIPQGCKGFYASDNSATSDIRGAIRDNRISYTVRENWSLEVTSFDATGFTITTRDASTMASYELGYLAIKMTGIDVWSGGIDCPNSTGNQAYTGPGFKPQFLFLMAGHEEAYNTDYTNALGGSQCYGAADDTDEYCVNGYSQDALAGSLCKCLSSPNIANVREHDDSDGPLATVVSYDATGFTLNYSRVEANVKKWYALAVEECAATAATADLMPYAMHLLTGRGGRA